MLLRKARLYGLVKVGTTASDPPRAGSCNLPTQVTVEMVQSILAIPTTNPMPQRA